MATRRRPMSEINVVPYIDVMLVLLVIFMATAPILMQGVEVDLPQADAEPMPTEDDDPLVISMNGDGQIFLNIGMTRETDTGRRVTIFSLAEQAGKIIRARPDVPVYVRADAGLPYGDVIDVMTVLQEAGAASVGLVTDPADLRQVRAGREEEAA
ncbi:MAG: protein TolR [Gammaproteobacteria bacterium]|nr:protein TolR [Gammaproteobacteria bacterium]